MSIYDLDLPNIQGSESLTIGERLELFFKGFSLSIDSLNAKYFNDTIHSVDKTSIWKTISSECNYFEVATKHIPSPVFFNPTLLKFTDYVNFVLTAIPILKLVDTQADSIYRSLKQCAATGKFPFSIRSVHNVIMINEAKDNFDKLIKPSEIYTRALNEVYSSFTSATELQTHFNKEVKSIKSRDVEICAKRVEQVVNIIKILKTKIDSSEIILNPKESETLNDVIKELSDNVNFAGTMIGLLSDLTRVLTLQNKEAVKLKN